MKRFEAIRAKNIERFRQAIPGAAKRLSWSREQIEDEQTRRLRETLAYAKANSPFYAERLRDIDPDGFCLEDLPGIPPVTKADVMEHWDDIVTDKRLTLAGANQHLADLHDGRKDNYYFDDAYYICATGGASGRRGLYLWDTDLFVTTAAVCHRMEAWEDSQSSPPENGRTAVICAGSYLHASRMLFPLSADPRREIKAISAGLPLTEIIETLNAFQPDRIISYSSVLEELCAAAVNGALTITPKRLSVNSEPLTEEARQEAQGVWGINIHNTWGSVEIGIGAYEGNRFDGLILAEDVLIAEGVAPSGTIIQEGDADRLLITRFYGNTLPLIRYEMTDQAVLASPGSAVAPAYRRIMELKGRADTWFQYGSIKIHPMVFRSVLGQEAAIIEYQVRQTKTGADIDLIIHDAVNIACLKNTLTDKLAGLGLNEPVLQIKAVDELPRHAETSKLTRFVPLK